MITTDYYSGVGSRDTPEHILNLTHKAIEEAAAHNYVVNQVKH